jgi:hypothetical protein
MVEQARGRVVNNNRKQRVGLVKLPQNEFLKILK